MNPQRFFFVLLVAALPAGVFAQPVRGAIQPSVSLSIRDTSGPTISRNIYGHFSEDLGRCIYDGFWTGDHIRMDVVEALKKIRIPVLRWPGG